jgi:hypothetical protein
MTVNVFDIAKFQSMNGTPLDEYASRMLAQGSEVLSGVDYDEIASLLRHADEYHSVYLLELCAKLDPNRVAAIAVPYLSSQVASLCCTASRILGSLEPQGISAEVRLIIEACPVIDLYWDDPTSGESRQVGTNEAFISELREKLGTFHPIR